MTKLSRLLLASALLGSAAMPAMAQTGVGAAVTTPPAAATGTATVQRPVTPAPSAAASGAVTATPAPATQAAKPAHPAVPHAAAPAPSATTSRAPAAGTTRTN